MSSVRAAFKGFSCFNCWNRDISTEDKLLFLREAVLLLGPES